MKPNVDRHGTVGLGLGLFVTLALLAPYSDRRELATCAAGYVLFALNYLSIAKLYRSLLLAAVAPSVKQKRLRLIITLGSALKLAGLVGALYVMLVRYALPGLYLAGGSLISLLVLTWILVMRYLRTLNLQQGQ